MYILIILNICDPHIATSQPIYLKFVVAMRCGHIWFTGQRDPNVAASQRTSKQDVYCDVANSGPRFLLLYFVKELERKHTQLLS